MIAAFSLVSRRFKTHRRSAWMILAAIVCTSITLRAEIEAEMRTEREQASQREAESSKQNATQQEKSDVPVPRTVEQPWMSLAEWRERHERQLSEPHRTNSRIVFLGDSITQGWGESEPFRASFDRFKPLNLGIGGDQTQHVLWRIENGALEGLRPRLLVVLIGVNNLTNDFSAEETANGVRAVVAMAKARLPRTRILLLAILPAGARPDDPLRRKIESTNRRLPAIAEPNHVAVHDVGGALLEPDGSIAATTMMDFLHPTPEGYTRLTSAVVPLVERIIGQ